MKKSQATPGRSRAFARREAKARSPLPKGAWRGLAGEPWVHPRYAARLRRLGAGALDDLLPVAVEHGGPRLTVLVPEIVDPCVQLLELGGDLGLVTLLGQDVPQLGSTRRGGLSFSSDVAFCRAAAR